MIEQPLPKLDFRCTSCGYGVVRLRPPERCPMCTGSRWLEVPLAIGSMPAPGRGRRLQAAREA